MKKIIFLLVIACVFSCTKSKSEFKSEWVREEAPVNFTVRFETTKGDFEVAVKREYSPKAADRFYQLVKHKYYDNAIFYRVVKDFVAQFGNSDLTQMKKWQAFKIPDEPVLYPNKKGTISFARAGKETRDLELFINLSDNSKLDTLDFEGVKGFPAFGNVTKGMPIVETLYSGYGEESMENSENLYLNRPLFYQTYPKLDLIRRAYLVE